MIITSTDSVDGHFAERYYGLVHGEAVLGVNVIKEWFAGITDTIGGRSSSYESEMEKARKVAIGEMEKQASDRGANAILAVSMDYEIIGKSATGNMMFVSACGTAVWLSKPKEKSGATAVATARPK